MSIEIKVKPKMSTQNSQVHEKVNDYKAHNHKNNHHQRPSVLLSWHNLEFKVKVAATQATRRVVPSHSEEELNVGSSSQNANAQPKSWNPVNYVKQKLQKVEKQVLQPMTGFVEPGTVLAIMGPSGSGKTSFLNLLAQRVKPSGGTIKINGENVSNHMSSFMACSAFVEQDDVLMGSLTVRETLRYAALLKMPSSKYTMKEKMERVDHLLKELGLEKSAETIVGVPGLSKGISGGERKRLSIAVEIINDPAVLFLDEVTTGLDARTSLNVIQTIMKLARQGTTIVLTIHQPRSDIFQMFDRLILLSRGRIAYFGDGKHVSQYFEKLGHECPEDYNIADYCIDLISENPSNTSDNPKKKQDEERRIVSILDHYENNTSQSMKTPKSDSDSQTDFKALKLTRNNAFSQFIILCLRGLLNTVRNKQLTTVKLFQQVVMALLVGLIFIRLGYTQNDVQNRIGALFFIMTNQIMSPLFGSVSSFHNDRPVLFRERGANLYNIGSFYFSNLVVQMPLSMFFPIFFGTMVYYIVGLNENVERFFMFLLILVVVAVAASSMGSLFAVLSPSFGVAMSIIPLVTTMLMLFGGFYRNVSNIPPYFIWIYWISIYHFGFEALVHNELVGAVFECPTSFCASPTGEAVIEVLEMNGPLSNIWINLGLMLAVALVCQIISFIVLVLFVKPKR